MRCEGKIILVPLTPLFPPEDAVSVPPVFQEKVVNDPRLHHVTGQGHTCAGFCRAPRSESGCGPLRVQGVAAIPAGDFLCSGSRLSTELFG